MLVEDIFVVFVSSTEFLFLHFETKQSVLKPFNLTIFLVIYISLHTYVCIQATKKAGLFVIYSKFLIYLHIIIYVNENIG